MRNRNPLRAATGGIFLIGLAIAFAVSGQYGGHWFLPVLFLTLACTSLLGSLNFNRRGVYSGSYGFVWFAVLALFFITNSWIWFLVGAGLSAILGSLWRPMIRGAFSGNQQPYYQPAEQQPLNYQPYQQGYQPPSQQPPVYQEGAQQHSYPPAQEPQYEQPQVQYPQEMPPPQQG